MSEQNKQVVRAVVDAFIAGDLDTVASHYDENIVYHGPGGEERRGREGAREVAAMYREAFPDVKMRVERIIAEGDFVFFLGHVSGTHEGDLPGLPASGKRLDLKWIMNLTRISNGKIVEEWEIFDQADFANQLGG